MGTIRILYLKHISKLEYILIIGAPAAIPPTMKLSILPTPRPRPKAVIAKGMVKSRNIYTHYIFIAFVCYQMDHIYLTLQLVQNAKTYVQANAQNLEIVEDTAQKDGQRKYVK